MTDINNNYYATAFLHKFNYGNSRVPLPLLRVLDHQEASHWLTDSWVRRCGCGDLRSHSTFQCTHVASQPQWSRPSGHRLPSWMEQVLVKKENRIGMGSGDARTWNWNLPYMSAFSRKALAFCPSSPEKALLKSSISMASCLVLSMKLFLIVLCTERAPACSCRECRREDKEMSLMVQDKNPLLRNELDACSLRSTSTCTSPFVCNAPHKTEQRTEMYMYVDAFLVLKIRYPKWL